MEYDNRDRGALFKNNDKTEEKHPDYRGNINVDGAEFWLSAWLKTSKNGMKYMSLAIKLKDDVARPQDFDDEIPF